MSNITKFPISSNLPEFLRKSRSKSYSLLSLQEEWMKFNVKITSMKTAKVYFRIIKNLKLEHTLSDEFFTYIYNNRKKINFSLGHTLNNKLNRIKEYIIRMNYFLNYGGEIVIYNITRFIYKLREHIKSIIDGKETSIVYDHDNFHVSSYFNKLECEIKIGKYFHEKLIVEGFNKPFIIDLYNKLPKISI